MTAHLVEPPNAIPIWRTIDTSLSNSYPDTLPGTACNHDYDPGIFQVYEQINDYSTTEYPPFTSDNLQHTSVAEVINGTEKTYTIRLLDGIPKGTTGSSIVYMPLKPSCPGVKRFSITADLTAKIETNNPGYERFAMYYCPPYYSNNLAAYYRGCNVAGNNATGYIASQLRSRQGRWERTHTPGSSKLTPGSYQPTSHNDATITIGSNAVEISDWMVQSLNWEDDEMIDRALIADSITGKLVSEDGTTEGITMTNLDSCPGFIVFYASTIDAMWQLEGGIFYEIILTINEIND